MRGATPSIYALRASAPRQIGFACLEFKCVKAKTADKIGVLEFPQKKGVSTWTST
jgi:hypothetical protein